MIIPVYKLYKYKEGDIIISLKDISGSYCLFTQNHEFTIKHIKTNSEINNIIIDNECGIVLNTPNFNDFTLKCDLNVAKDRYIELNNNLYIKNFILKNCPHKDYSYEEYTKYDSCNIKKSYSNGCNVDIDECINHIPLEKINNDERIITILRSKKINKIKDVL